MATLGRTKRDGHFFILLGPSKGTRQITDEGINWLLQQGYQLLPGEHVQLHRGDFLYLGTKGYLYIKGIDYNGELSEISSPEHKAEKEGLPLLLKLSPHSRSTSDSNIPWELTLQFDALEDHTLKELREKQAKSITTTLSDRASHLLNIQCLREARFWPPVPPQSSPYYIYCYSYQNKLFSLQTALPTQGLQKGWRGNIFLRLNHPQFTNTWRRSHIDEQVSFDIVKEFYWIAQSGQDPEDWPDLAQRVGTAYQNWQLWQLQIKTPDNWEAIQHWFSYRLVRLTFPTWRLRVLSPFYGIQEYHTISSSEHTLLLQCDPPDQASANASSPTSLVLTSRQASSSWRPTATPLKSDTLQWNQRNYFLTPSLLYGHEYSLRFVGEITGPSLSTQINPPSKTQPVWLRGLRCTLTSSHTQYQFYAFEDTPQPQQSYHLHVTKDFSLDDFSKLTWRIEPAEIPYSFTWDYDISRGEICHCPPATSLLESTLNTWWQEHIWPALTKSPWARITIDATSFGQIVLILDLKSEQLEDIFWEPDEQLSATFIWLSNIIEAGMTQQKSPVPLSLRKTLLQLSCSPNLSPILANAFRRLALYNHMPTWVQVRLQIALAETERKQLLKQKSEEEK